MSTTEQWTRVILLVPPALQPRGVDQAMQAQFAARDWFPIHVHDPYIALAELCVREKSQISRSAWGLQRLEQISLVILEPAEWESASVHVRELIATVQRYVPVASVWLIQGDQIVPAHLAAMHNNDFITPSALGSPNGHATAQASAMHGQHMHAEHQAGPLRLSSVPARAANTRDAADDDVPSSTRLTREEIEMLLDPLGTPESGVAS